jgi:hypothetical protein
MPDSEIAAQDPAALSSRLNHEGSLAYGKGDIGVAYMHFIGAILADNSNHLAWMNTSAALISFQKAVSAEIAARRALAFDPTSKMIRVNLSNALMGQRRWAEVNALHKEICSNDMLEPGPWHNWGLSLYMQEEFDRAIGCFDRALELSGGSRQVKNDMAIALLASGRLDEALELYEVRWDTLWKSPAWNMGLPQWQGEQLDNKGIIIAHEQGFGDSLMLCRFINNIHAIYPSAKIGVTVPKELVELFKFNFPYSSVYDHEQIPVGLTDYHYFTPMLSMMRWLGYAHPEDIVPTPYLQGPGKFHFTAKGEIKVGICWSSGDHGYMMHRRRRQIMLEKFLPLAAYPRVRLYSLQKGDAEKEIQTSFAQAFVMADCNRTADFADTADIISQLDFVVTVDTAVAHLAGAMGKPTLMLMPNPRCWRWWEKYNGLPWYKDMAIFQQAPDGSWDIAMDELISEFQSWIR